MDPATPHYHTTTPAHTSSFHLFLPFCTHQSPPPIKVGAFRPDQSPLPPLTPPHHTTTPQTPHTPHPFTCSFPSAPTYRHPLQICTPPRLVFRGHCPFVALCLVGGGGRVGGWEGGSRGEIRPDVLVASSEFSSSNKRRS